MAKKREMAKIPLERTCSFCGRSAAVTDCRIIVGPHNVCICEECVDVCAAILAEENPGETLDWLKRILVKAAKKINPKITELVIPVPAKEPITSPPEYVDSLNDDGKEWIIEFFDYMSKHHKKQKITMFRQCPMYKKEENYLKGYLMFTAAKTHFSVHTLYFDLIEEMKTILPAAKIGKGCVKVKYTDTAAKAELKKLCDRVIDRFKK